MSDLTQKGTPITDRAPDEDIDDDLRDELNRILTEASPRPYPNQKVLRETHLYLAIALDRDKKLAAFICKEFAQFENLKDLEQFIKEMKRGKKLVALKKIIDPLSQIQDPKIRQATYEALRKQTEITSRTEETRAAVQASSIPQGDSPNTTNFENRDIEIEKELTVLLFTWSAKAETGEDKKMIQLFFRTPKYIYFKLLVKTHHQHQIEEDELLREILEKFNSISSQEKQQEIFERLHNTNCIS